jgi:hypothetical protein
MPTQPGDEREAARRQHPVVEAGATTAAATARRAIPATAAAPPVVRRALAVDETREERDPDHAPDAHRQQGIRERSDAVARHGVHRAARRPACAKGGTPGERAAGERRGEQDAGDHEPVRVGRRDADEAVAHAVAQTVAQLGGERLLGKEQDERERGRERERKRRCVTDTETRSQSAPPRERPYPLLTSVTRIG